MDDKPHHRRWYQFSLRTMLIVVAVIACALAWETQKVKSRGAVLVPGRSGVYGISIAGERRPWIMMIDDSRLSWQRKLLGDHFVWRAQHSDEVSPEEVNQIKTLFPEAEVGPIKDSG